MPKITEILLQKINSFDAVIENWFADKFKKNPALFYNSIDLRHADFKLAPIDTNCYPAGFNHLSSTSKDATKIIADDFLCKNFPDAKKILIIPENHTQNLHYLENVYNLQEILAAKREVVVGSLIEDLKDVTKIDLENGHFVTLHPLKLIDKKLVIYPVILDAQRRGSQGFDTKTQEILEPSGFKNDVVSDGFVPDLIVLNNDLTTGIPQILENIPTPIIPPMGMGWYRRSKSQHFTIYNQLAAELGALIDLDPWLISSFHDVCHDLDFKAQIGLESLAKSVDELLLKISKKYQEYGINEQPYCYIKADNGTYGIAVWPVFSGKDVLEINKKERNKMSMLKGSVQNTSVILQEGIKTVDKINSEIAEPMIYLMQAQVTGNLFRVNNGRDEKISLNAAGANFFDLTELSENQISLGAEKNNVTKIYSLIARLATLAAAVENKLAAAVENEPVVALEQQQIATKND